MCGIAGFLYKKNESLSQVSIDLQSMGDAIARRGPDSRGIIIEDDFGLALAHSRLSIHDLSPAGSQPMISSSGRYVIVFNGEIYNYKHLQSEISNNNSHFTWRSSSDTEVLLELIENQGLASALQKIDGMYAFALLDRQESLLYLARDHFGEKPLYYGWHQDQFLFASNIDSIKSHSLAKPVVDSTAADLFIRYGYVPSPLSILSQTYKLKPGHLLKLNLASRRINYIKCYYQASRHLKTNPTNQIYSLDKAKHILRDKLINVIADMSVSDAPLGVFLSSGIDSALVSSILKKEVTSDVSSFTLGFHQSERDESSDARRIANHLGLNHNEILISPQDILSLLSDLNKICSEPLGDPSILPTSLICKFASQKVKVCLSGDGADELFAGYTHYKNNRFIYLWKALSILPKRNKNAIVKQLNSLRNYLRKSTLNFNTSFEVKLKSSIGTLMSLLLSDNYVDLYKFLNSQWRPYGLLINGISDLRLFGPQTDEVPSGMKPYLVQSMLTDCLMYLPDCILHKVDSASMFYGLEVRSPFLHRQISEFSGQIHHSLKSKNSISKYVLKELLYDYVPKDLLHLSKKGFGIPLASWLRGPLSDWSYNLLQSSGVQQLGLSKDLLLAAWSEHVSCQKNHCKALWNVLVLLNWYDSLE